MDRKTTIALILAILLAGGSVYLVVNQSRSGNTTPTSPVSSDLASTSQQTTIIPGTGVEIMYDKSENVTPTIPVPDLTRSPVFGPFATPQTKETAVTKISDLQEKLRLDPLIFENWIELGLTFSSVGDYEGALSSYTYASALRPKSFLPHANMGFVYGWYLKEPAKAEVEYKKAIEINPGEWYINLQLFELYRDVMQDKAKAKAFAEARSKEIPAFALDFKVLISELDRK